MCPNSLKAFEEEPDKKLQESNKANLVNQILENVTQSLGLNLVEEYLREIDQQDLQVVKSEEESNVSREIKCYDCEKVFIRGSREDSISKHIKMTSCKPFQCIICKSLFRTNSALKTHEKTHDNLSRKFAGVKRFRETDTKENSPPLKKLKMNNVLQNIMSKKYYDNLSESDEYRINLKTNLLF